MFIDAASFLLMGLLVLTLPTITREPPFAQHAAANRWLGFGALFSLRYVPALTLLSLVLARTVHDLYFEPKYEAFRPWTIWSLSNAFTSAFKDLEPISQFRATAKLGEFLEAPVLTIVLACGRLIRPRH
jgi:hypothetical protein